MHRLLYLGICGIVASLGIFDNINTIRWDFYVHFTNISNFLCIGVMAASLIQTARKKDDSCVIRAPLVTSISILVLAAYTVLTKKEWKIPALEIIMRAGYGIALITGIVRTKVHGVAALANVHKAGAAVFVVLAVLFVLKLRAKKNELLPGLSCQRMDGLSCGENSPNMLQEEKFFKRSMGNDA